jgi:hypothetical protein
MAKFKLIGNEDVVIADDESEAMTAISSVLKNLVCPICSKSNFTVAEKFNTEFGTDLRTRIPFYGLNYSIPCTYYRSAFTLICDECTHILQFDETKIFEKYENQKKATNV